MIRNRYRLTPHQKRRLGASAKELRLSRDLADSQYLIANRLRELAVLLKEKNNQFSNIRLRIQTNGPSAILERELVQIKDQILDLIHLGDEWQNSLLTIQPSLKRVLRSLGVSRSINSLRGIKTHNKTRPSD